MRESLRRLFRVSNPPAGPLKYSEPKKGWTRRFRMMMRHTWLVIIALVLMAAGLAGVGYYFSSQPVQLRIAVGPPNSEDVRVVQAIAQQLARDHAKVRLRVIVVDGGVREARTAIDNDKADLAIVRRDVGMPRDGQVVAIWRKNVAVFIVPKPEPEKPAAKTATAAAKKTAAKAKATKAAKAAKAAKDEE